MKEGFVKIKNHKGYWINKEGIILNSKFKELKYHISNKGYARIMLSDTRKNHSIHRLVAIQFIPNTRDLPQVNHKDGNKLNNKVSNLEWCTHSENGLHSYRVLGRTKYWEGVKGKNNPLSKQILCLETGEVYENSRVAEEKTGIIDSSIARCCQGKRISAGGYSWKYFNSTLLSDLAISLGFDGIKDNSILIFMTLLAKWLREKHNMHILINVGMNDGIKQTFYCNVCLFGKNLYKSMFRSKTSIYTYEEALEEGLKQGLMLIKDD